MRIVTWNHFPIKNLRLIPCLFHLLSEITWIQICASLNHRKKMKAETSRLIPRNPTEILEFLFVDLFTVQKYIKSINASNCMVLQFQILFIINKKAALSPVMPHKCYLSFGEPIWYLLASINALCSSSVHTVTRRILLIHISLKPTEEEQIIKD